ncbi:hypothetical protein MBLNU230_g1208t1 [Neophaeotheca triangularis]
MASALDDLLNDFGDDSGEENGEGEQQGYDIFGRDNGDGGDEEADKNGGDGNAMSMDIDAEGNQHNGDGDGDSSDKNEIAKTQDDEAEEERNAEIEKMSMHKVDDVRTVLTLFKDLDPVLQEIKRLHDSPPTDEARYAGRTDDNPEYKLLTKANNFTTRIDGEMALVHRWLRDHYSARFPELEQLIINPLDYAKAVYILGNVPTNTIEIKDLMDSTDNTLNQTLEAILDKGTCQAIAYEAVQTRGQPLSDSELASIRRACGIQFQLHQAKITLSNFAESRMSIFAPNLTTLIGTLTATQLINSAGGISELAATPACNLIAAGNKKKNAALGLASNIGVKNQGYLYNNTIVQTAPKNFTVQAMRMLSAKVALCARMDMMHQSKNGEAGLDFLQQIDKRLSAISKVPDSAKTKALPAPDDKPARKRGGRRARKAKEATAMTDLRKAQNRMAFGKEEAQVGYGSGDSTMGMGMIGQNDGVRGTKIDQRTRAKLSKKNPGWGGATSVGGGGSGAQTALRSFGAAGATGSATALSQQGLRTSGVGGLRTAATNPGGTASTIAFSSGQGLELVDPRERELKRKREEEKAQGGAGQGWFGPGGGAATAVPKVDAGGFKIPALPGSKKAKMGQ